MWRFRWKCWWNGRISTYALNSNKMPIKPCALEFSAGQHMLGACTKINFEKLFHFKIKMNNIII